MHKANMESIRIRAGRLDVDLVLESWRRDETESAEPEMFTVLCGEF